MPRGQGISIGIPVDGSYLTAQLNMVPSEMKGQVANWQRAEQSLARLFTNHPGPSHGASAMKEEYLTLTLYITCISSHFCVRRAEGNLFEIYKTHRPQWKVWLFRCLVGLDIFPEQLPCFLFAISTPHATGQPHIISLADILLPKWKKWFQRKTLKWGIMIIPQQYHSFWLPKWKSDPITDLRIRRHLK